MRLTLYADYTLRVMMYLALKARAGGGATIQEMADAYRIPRNHLTKIVNELAHHHFIETTRGRAGGARLVRSPDEISIGAIVRMAEKDLAVVACNDAAGTSCAIQPACALKARMRRAMDAFLRELDSMTLADAILSPADAAELLHLPPLPAGAAAARAVPGAAPMEAIVPASALRLRRRPSRNRPRRPRQPS